MRFTEQALCVGKRRYTSSAWELVYFITAVSTSSFGTGYYHHAKPKLWFRMLSFCIEIVDDVLARHIVASVIRAYIHVQSISLFLKLARLGSGGKTKRKGGTW
jgi:hypothetical protein